MYLLAQVSLYVHKSRIHFIFIFDVLETTQQAQYVGPMLIQCWASVVDGGCARWWLLFVHWLLCVWTVYSIFPEISSHPCQKETLPQCCPNIKPALGQLFVFAEYASNIEPKLCQHRVAVTIFRYGVVDGGWGRMHDAWPHDLHG